MSFRVIDRRGFSLVEVVLALGIAAFCLVTVSGLLLFGVRSSDATFDQTAAAGIGAAVIAELQGTPTPPPLPAPTQPTISSPRFMIPIPISGVSAANPVTFNIDQSGTVGPIGVGPTTASAYRVAVAFNVNPGTATVGQRCAISARVMVSWPALADPAASTWPQHALGSWETVVNLDRY